MIFLLLVISSWIPSYAQTGKDTLTCYNNQELQQIATRVVRANECDTLLSVCEKQMAFKDSAITMYEKHRAAKDIVINEQKNIILLKEDIITGKDTEIAGLREAWDSEKNKLKWTRVGWAATTVGLLYLLLK